MFSYSPFLMSGATQVGLEVTNSGFIESSLGLFHICAIMYLTHFQSPQLVKHLRRDRIEKKD
jgi:hypothetical protein